MRFDVLITVIFHILVLWVIVQCEGFQRFGRTYYLNLHGTCWYQL